MKAKRYDIIMLGSGLPGSILAAIIARMGLKILMIEKGQHPRFAIGEAMLPQSTMWMLLLGERFKLPEIEEITSVDMVNKAVSKHCGQKRTISFMYHHEGRRQDQRESHQVIAPEVPFSSESHFLRSEIDEHMVGVAQRCGADYIDQTDVVEFDLKENDVSVTTDKGESFHARLLIDGSGFRSPIADRYDLRKDPETLNAHSRTIFNHFTGLKNYDMLDGVVRPSERYGYNDGTLHHVFDGGWFWVIPFGNHPKSESEVSSIGLSLDTTKYPKPDDVGPEEEFWSFVDKLPSVKEHFEHIKPLRPWVGTGRLQYTAKQSAGPGFVMLSHAYGFIDALLSRGMINSFETVYYIGKAVESCAASGDFSLTHFEHLNQMQDEQINATDRMVASAYNAMQGFPLWNAWFNMWLGSKLLGDLYFMRGVVKTKMGDSSFFERVDESVRADKSAPYTDKVEEMLALLEDCQKKIAAGEMTIDAGAEKFNELVRNADWLPHTVYPWGTPASGDIDFTEEAIREIILNWGPHVAPAWLGEKMFDFIPPWFPEAMVESKAGAGG